MVRSDVLCCARGEKRTGGGERGRGAIDGETVIDLIVDRFSPTSRTLAVGWLVAACWVYPQLASSLGSGSGSGFSSGLPRGCGTAP